MARSQPIAQNLKCPSNSKAHRASTKKAPSKDGAFFVLSSRLVRQGAVDGAEGITDLGSENTHNSNNNDGDESEDDRVLDEALAFFFGCK